MSTDKVTYTFVKEEGNILFRSKVNSFNLDHVTDKNIVSFYQNFSNYAAMDTGLLPVDGTGLLAIRSAGNHTQVAYQYKPGMYYVNWGASEGDPNAVSYLVAQPYRIVIIDFVDNNLLGARTFYSPIPATHPGIQLYHVNLPNINCRGYRGNGVGWICLYHNQDWSKMPFNERLARALERCSGIEVYNDANMSETDGPRFYASKSKPSYITNPREWEDKSQAEGFEWTIDENLWIPIMVKSRDEQGQHYDGEGSVPLTLGDAIVGKYNAYYNDSYHPKPINALTNPDLELDPKTVTSWFVKSYNDSSTSFVGIDPFLQSQQTRQNIANTQLTPQSLKTSSDVPDSENTVQCTSCEDLYDEDDVVEHSDEYWCTDCFNETFVHCENTDEYLHQSDDNLYYNEHDSEYYDLGGFKNYSTCSNCSALHYVSHTDFILYHSKTSHWDPNIWMVQAEDGTKIELCSECIADEDIAGVSTMNCGTCSCTIPQSSINHSFSIPTLADEYNIIAANNICSTCSSKQYSKKMSITGTAFYEYDIVKVLNPKSYIVDESNFSAAYIAITDYMKSNDMDIHDQYYVQITDAPSVACDLVPAWEIQDQYNNDDSFNPPIAPNGNGYYRLIKTSVSSALDDNLQHNGVLFGKLIENHAVTLTPYNEPF